MKLYGAPSSRLFPMAKDASNVSHRISKRAKYINKTRDGKIYKTNRTRFKEMVLRLTGTTLNSRQLDGLRPSPLAHVSSPQPFRLNGAPIPPLPYRYPAAPIRTNAVNTSTTELSNTQTPSPPSLPSSFPPPSPRGQESMEASVAAFMQYFEDRMAEDDPNQEHFSDTSLLIHSIPTSDKEQQTENIPPHVPANSTSEILDSPDCLTDPRSDNISPPVPPILPSENLDWPKYRNDLRSENIQPPVTATVPSGSLDWPKSRNKLRSEKIPPPVPAPSSSEILYRPNSTYYIRSENIPPPIPATLPSENLLNWPNISPNDIRLENIPPPVPATLPSWNLEWPNYPNNLQSKNLPPPVFGTVPSWNLDLPNYPSVLRSKNFPPPSSSGFTFRWFTTGMITNLN